ncbi:MAG TPA: hypothetical protein VL576_00610 [Candidatus Paceibacterota bacterium]|jgi:hypothetical protein|nr:hypothetical protein [Candidatus Paceibacterota bacterium]
MLQPQTSSFKTFLIKTLTASIIAVFAFGFFNHAEALTISPARVEITGDPGATVGGEFTLINEQSTDQTFYPSFENFTAQGESGSPAFSADPDGLDSWMSIPNKSVTIKPGEVLTVPYYISIPKGTEPGGYFAAIFWSTTPPTAGSGDVSIGAKIGMLVLLTVNGNVRESAGITQFDRNGHGFFYETLPVTLRYKFHNAGGDRVQPKGTMTIRDTFFLPADHIDANKVIGNILPNSTRQFTVDWIKDVYAIPPQGFFANVGYEWHNFALGLYSAHINLAYGTKGLHAKGSTWFFVFPWQLVICIIVGLFIIWRLGRIVITRYNRYIIGKARALQSDAKRP